jgi:hypothetical protein
MDNDGNFQSQSISNMQNAVYRGEMSVVDYYERQVHKIFLFCSLVDYYATHIMLRDLLTQILTFKKPVTSLNTPGTVV